MAQIFYRSTWWKRPSKTPTSIFTHGRLNKKLSNYSIGLTHSILKSPNPPDKGGYGGLGDLGGLKNENYRFLRLNV